MSSRSLFRRATTIPALLVAAMWLGIAHDAHGAPPVPAIAQTIESTITAGSASSDLGANSWSRSLVRGFDGKLHAVWGDPAASPPMIVYASSSDNGVTWSAPYLVHASTLLAGQPVVKIDNLSRVHVIWNEDVPDWNRAYHRFIDASGVWSPVHTLRVNLGEEFERYSNPAMDALGTMSLLRDGGHNSWFTMKTWNGIQWGPSETFGSWTGDHFYQNAVPDGSNLHYFAYEMAQQKLLTKSRVGAVWSTPSLPMTFTVTPSHNEVLDAQGDIRVFVTDQSPDSRVLVSTMDLPSRTHSPWEVFDSESGLDVGQPSATLDNHGNIWVFYSVGDEICYRVYDKSADAWTGRAYLTDSDIGGVAASPKVRYQVYHSRSGGRLDLTYRVTQPSGTYALIYKGLVLEGGNAAPVQTNDAYASQVDKTLQVPAPGVLGNDRDSDGDSLSASASVEPQHGVLDLHADGSFEYTPDAGWSGADSFAYVGSDGTSASPVATVNITVRAPSAPVAVADAYLSGRGATVTIASPGVLANDRDLNTEDVLSTTLVSAPATGTLDLAANGSFTYVPPIGYQGTVAFSYRASDGALESGVVTATIQLNYAPVAQAEDYYIDEYESISTVAENGVLHDATDADGDELTVVLVRSTANGQLLLRPDGSFSYTHNDGFAGTDSFTYYATDGQLRTATTTVRIIINPGAAIDGHVYDAETGLPLEGILVRVSDYRDDAESDYGQSAVTDANGHYRVLKVTDEAYSYVSFIDKQGVYRDEHLWSQGLPITQSVPDYFAGLTSSVDAYLMTEESVLTYRATRISGASRYDTAVRASQFWLESETVVLASGIGYADALSAAPLAGSYSAPILLTPPSALPQSVSAEIGRLKAKRVVIVGGTAAVSVAVESDLKRRGLSVVRIAGADRYSTCLAITRHLVWREGENLSPEPFVVRGDNYADALAVAPFAWNQVRPILLVRPTDAPYAIVTAFNELNSDSIIIVGGYSAVGEDAMYDLWSGALAPEGRDLKYWRVAGKNRYDTAAKVGRFWRGHFDRYVIASGKTFPDALAGGPLMGAFGGAMLLTTPEYLSSEAAAVLSEDGQYLWCAWILGGEKAVYAGTAAAVRAKIGDELYQMDHYAITPDYGSPEPPLGADSLFSPLGGLPKRMSVPTPDERASVADLEVAPQVYRPGD